jgi:hypothetical protein
MDNLFDVLPVGIVERFQLLLIEGMDKAEKEVKAWSGAARKPLRRGHV